MIGVDFEPRQKTVANLSSNQCATHRKHQQKPHSTGWHVACPLVGAGTNFPTPSIGTFTLASIFIHIVSGGSGGTAAQVVRACTSQFTCDDVHIVPHPWLQSRDAIGTLFSGLRGQNAIICHSLVDPELRSMLSENALEAGIPCVDIMGPLLAVLGERLSASPLGKPGLLYELHKEQFDRMDAVDFTMAHDDGSRLHDLDQADIVIVGISRVSKSVTCFYLASRGIKAANVPLLPGQPPAEELRTLPACRVFGLTMNASHLASIRQSRLNRIGAEAVADYASIREINREIHFAEQQMSENGWRKIDVSYRATEEVASHILDLLRKAGR